jgi:glycosyltransferase involved in cell wall biosynthesis
MSEPDEPASCAVLIPAFEEAATVATVIRVALEADVGPVVVIDDGSRDATATVAERAGAEVLRLDVNVGKGGAVAAGARARTEAVVVLLDADLTGLRPVHVRALAQPVRTGEVDMTRGVFEGGRWMTTAAQHVAPLLNGQRAIRRELLLEVEGLETSRYGVEVAITGHGRRRHWRTRDVALADVSQVMKEEKRGWWRGQRVRWRMYGEIVRQFVRESFQRNAPRR